MPSTKPRRAASKGPKASSVCEAVNDPVVAPQPAVDGRTAFITVGLSKGRGFSSWWIRWLAKGGWSHCIALVLPGGMEVIDARSDVIEGIEEGVQIRPISYLKGEECLWLEIPCTPIEAKEIEAAARSVVGDKYDKTGIFDFVDNGVDNSWKQGVKEFFCSALGAWICWRGKRIPQEVLVPFTNITPGAALDMYWGMGARKAETPLGLR